MPDTIQPLQPTQATDGQPRQSRAQERFDELVAARGEAIRSRDTALSALAELRKQNEDQVAALQRELAELKTAVQQRPSGPSGVLPSFETADDQALVQAATQGGFDPVSGQRTPPDPATAFRAQMELLKRQVNSTLKAELDSRLGSALKGIKDEQAGRDAMAQAERQILGLYGEEAQPGKPLFQTAKTLMPHMEQAYGKGYTQTPQGLQHLFAESDRLMQRQRLGETTKELETRRQELARLTASAPGSAAPSVTDATKEALAKKDWRGALAGSKFAKSFSGQA